MPTMAVLLIGSTGSGKSALGNFLLDPTGKKQFFEVSSNNLPTTQETKGVEHLVEYQKMKPKSKEVAAYDSKSSYPKQHDGSKICEPASEDSINGDGDTSSEAPPDDGGYTAGIYGQPGAGHSEATSGATGRTFAKMFTHVPHVSMPQFFKVKTMVESLKIIDTPGLNESGEKDLEHMIGVVRMLHKFEFVRSCIFVVKFKATIDAQYRKTIEFYSKQLPSLFRKSCIIVMTNYATDPYSEIRREECNINYNEIQENVRQEVRECSCTTSEPIVFPIDSRPAPRTPTYQDELDRSLHVRNAILSKIFSHTPLDVRDIKVAKSESMLQKHAQRINDCKNEISEHNMELKRANQTKAKSLDAIQLKEADVTAIDEEIVRLTEELEDKNSDDIVTVAEWVIERPFKWFKWQSTPFQMKPPCEIDNVKRWTNGCSTIQYKRGEDMITGVVQGNFMRGLYASVTLEAKKKIKFAQDIINIRQKTADKRKKHSELKQELKEEIESADKTDIAIKSLSDIHEAKRVLIAKLASNQMTLEDAELELKDFQKEKHP